MSAERTAVPEARRMLATDGGQVAAIVSFAIVGEVWRPVTPREGARLQKAPALPRRMGAHRAPLRILADERKGEGRQVRARA